MKTGPDMVYDMDTGSGSYAAAIGTKKGVIFIEFGGSGLDKKRGMNCRDWIVSTQFFPDGRLAAGSTKGKVYLFSGNSAIKDVDLH